MDFRQPYNRTTYITFFRNQLLSEDFEEHEEEVSISFKPQRIQKITKIGEARSLDLAVYEIEHKSENDPRVLISRDAFRFMAQYGVQKALILFISKNSPNFRLSLVTIDLKWEEGKRVEREYSNPRRYSFFLGPDTKTHTPEEYLIKEGRVKDFDDLKKRFSIEVVNKEFYRHIAILFTKFAGGTRKIGKEKWDEKGLLKLPSTSDDTLKKEFSVRLIGRLVFCWFLKKKSSDKGISLLPEKLLSTEAVSTTRGFYHSVLEPLFFAVLNTPVDDRDKKYDADPWAQVPFLNGGLFTPGNHDFYDVDKLGTSKHLNTLIVPDQWLNDLFEVFETYNFTIDENTSVDVELSIEPEMLGRIFENLLAEINPETGETARKATGSYYTPRPIVEYMVDQSLKQYLLTKTQIKEDKIYSLLSYEDEKVELTDNQKESILDALDTIKIIDPACGSGAFPMGILQKMLLILQKIDPESKNWLSRQLAKIENKMVKKELEKKLKRENWDYVHKLGIIQSSIYGVDIQPIAVEISKLRFFLSLIVDESIDDKKPNRGIVPLPNLEFKFVAANSLIGLPEYKKGEDTIGLFEAGDDIRKLKELRDFYFTSYGKEKQKIEKEFEETQQRMFQHSIDWQTTDSQTMTLSQWNPFSDEAVSWFDPEWMFGVNEGFDITIGNPPYVRADSGEDHLALRQHIIKSNQYKTLWEKWDLFIPFIELAYKLLREKGITTMIVSDAYCHSKYAQKSQQWFLRNSRILRLDFLSKIKVFEAGVHNIVYFYQKDDGALNKPERRVHHDKFGTITQLSTDIQKNLNYRVFFPEDDFSDRFSIPVVRLNDICYVFVGMVVNAHEKKAPGAFDMDDLVVNRKDSIHPKAFVEGKHLDRWLPATNKFLEWGTVRAPALFRRPTFPELYEVADKILVQRSPGPDPKACYDNQRLHFTESTVGFILWYRLANVRNNSLKKIARYKDEKPYRPDLPKREQLEKTSSRFNLKYLLGIINSSYARYFLRGQRRSNIHLYPDDWKNLPIPDASKEKQSSIVELVDQILTSKKNTPHVDISSLDKELDKMVYKLYNLTPEEIAIVESRIVCSLDNL